MPAYKDFRVADNFSKAGNKITRVLIKFMGAPMTSVVWCVVTIKPSLDCFNKGVSFLSRLGD